MTLRALLFDKDGTLVDFDATWGPAAYDVMTAMAGDDRAALERLMHVSHYDETSRRFKPTSPLVAGSSGDYGPVWAEALRRPFSTDVTDEMDRRFVEAGLIHLSPIGDPAGVLTALKGRGLALGIVTNDSEAGARSQARALGIDHHLDYVVGWDSGFGRKPAPGQIHAYLERTGLPAHAVAMIGDSLHDLHAARAAGVLAVGVETGPIIPEGFAEAADVVLPSIMALEDWLDG